MAFTDWTDKRIARMNWMDVALLKVCVIAFTLMIAKIWPVVLTPHWAIFAFLFLLAYAPLKQVQIGRLAQMMTSTQTQQRPAPQASDRGFNAWMEARIANLDTINIGLLKTALIILSLLVAKFWPPVLTPDWWVFGLVFIVTYIPLAIKLLIRQDD